MNEQHVTLLVLLGLSAAFDTVSHTILLSSLRKLGIGNTALEWFKLYLSGGGQRATVGGCLSERVPEGSCLGPPLFTSHSRSLIDAVQDHLPSIHCYADDTQLYVSFDPVMKETSQMRLPLWSVTLSPSGSG